jgi:sulfite oxidase
VRAETVNWDKGEMLGALPINSFITSPCAGALPAAETRSGAVLVQGIALAGDAAVIERVELSCDGGQTWTAATLTSSPQQWVWCFWEAICTAPPGIHELVVRAFDSAGHTQPEHLADVWNFKGYVNNAYYRVRVTI